MVRNQYSPIMPLRLLQSLIEYQMRSPINEHVLGNYFLLLAHDVLKNPKEYTDIFQDRSLVPDDTFVILDNSVIELGTPLGVEFLLEAAEAVSPDCIILPDVLGDMRGSLAAARKAHNAIKENITGYDGDIHMMAVLQGRNVAELTRCAIAYAELEGIQYYGCPRWVANAMGTRKVFESVLGIHHEVRMPNVHMLGMSTVLEDDIACTQLPGVMGIDSANPIVMGQQGIYLERDNYRHYPREDGTFDFWKETEVTETTINNILTMRRWLNGRR